MILDVGPAAVEALGDAIKNCRTLVWNGPLGAFETPPFDAATVALAKIAAALTQDGSLVSVAGGGDTVAALNHAGVAADFSFVSTAGGAFLEWMEGRTLPGVAALSNTGVIRMTDPKMLEQIKRGRASSPRSTRAADRPPARSRAMASREDAYVERRGNVRRDPRDAHADHHLALLQRRQGDRRDPVREDDGRRGRRQAGARRRCGRAAWCRSSRSTRGSRTRPTASS